MERIMIRGWKEPVFKKNDNFSLLHFKFNPTLTLIYLAILRMSRVNLESITFLKVRKIMYLDKAYIIVKRNV